MNGQSALLVPMSCPKRRSMQVNQNRLGPGVRLEEAVEVSGFGRESESRYRWASISSNVVVVGVVVVSDICS